MWDGTPDTGIQRLLAKIVKRQKALRVAGRRVRYVGEKSAEKVGIKSRSGDEA
jgi:hypothetical protein